MTQNEIIDNEQKSNFIHEHNAYQRLWNFFYNEHGLTLLHSEIDEIIYEVNVFKQTYNNEKKVV